MDKYRDGTLELTTPIEKTKGKKLQKNQKEKMGLINLNIQVITLDATYF